mmetsp:Transcript_34698/g.83870  ORF Transcript_34698/g.83870 Transcript_34698/m.83870 type:complete len:308 (-) Transcript_34698:297-1220(-)
MLPRSRLLQLPHDAPRRPRPLPHSPRHPRPLRLPRRRRLRLRPSPRRGRRDANRHRRRSLRRLRYVRISRTRFLPRRTIVEGGLHRRMSAVPTDEFIRGYELGSGRVAALPRPRRGRNDDDVPVDEHVPHAPSELLARRGGRRGDRVPLPDVFLRVVLHEALSHEHDQPRGLRGGEGGGIQSEFERGGLSPRELVLVVLRIEVRDRVVHILGGRRGRYAVTGVSRAGAEARRPRGKRGHGAPLLRWHGTERRPGNLSLQEKGGQGERTTILSKHGAADGVDINRAVRPVVAEIAGVGIGRTRRRGRE